MKVAYVLGSFPSLSETFILREIEALARQGIDIALFSLRMGASHPIHPQAKRFFSSVQYPRRIPEPQIARTGVRIAAAHLVRTAGLLAHAVRADLRHPLRLARASRSFAAALDFAARAAQLNVTHIHAHFAFVTADVARLMAVFLNRTFSVSAHAWDLFAQPDQALRQHLNGAAFIAVCTEQGRERLRRLLPDANLVLIRHGLPLDEFRPVRAEGTRVLAVGRLEDKKGFVHLIDACRILKQRNVPFDCVIAGNGSRRRLLERKINQLALKTAVRLTGALTHHEILALYRQAAVFVLPSVITSRGDRDGISNALLEAMAMGLPVVSTRDSACGEAVRNGVHGYLVPARDPETLAAKIEILLRDAPLRARMGAACRKTVATGFDITRNIQQLVRMFRETAAGQNRIPDART